MRSSDKPKVQLHEYSKPLDLNTTVWRYLSLEAALTTLNSSTLRFTRLGAFPDEFEGTEDFDSIAAHRVEAELFSESFNHPIMYRDPEITKILNQKTGYASCWSLNPPTDMVMWRNYASELSSVALKTTVGNLMECLVDGFLCGIALHPLMALETRIMAKKVVSAVAPGMPIEEPEIAYR